MPFVPPTFNLKGNAWHNRIPLGVFPISPPTLPPDLPNFDCQLYGWSLQILVSGDNINPSLVYQGNYMLRCPKLTDLRDSSTLGGADILEVPAGSGRWYWAAQVDDMHKGFPNEYRVAMALKLFTWPSPIP